jgi:hypothetical protein
MSLFLMELELVIVVALELWGVCLFNGACSLNGAVKCSFSPEALLASMN